MHIYVHMSALPLETRRWWEIPPELELQEVVTGRWESNSGPLKEQYTFKHWVIFPTLEFF